MSRLRDLRRDQLDATGQDVWDKITGSRPGNLVNEAGGLVGPFNAFVTAPEVGRRMNSLGAAVRFGTSIDRRLSEVVIITVGARWKAEFEWWAHAQYAAQYGVPAAVIEAIGAGEDPPFEADDERIVYTAARELVTTGHLGQATYDTAAKLLGGDAAMVELVATCGYYSLISILLNAFQVPLPPGNDLNWPDAVAPDGSAVGS